LQAAAVEEVIATQSMVELAEPAVAVMDQKVQQRQLLELQTLVVVVEELETFPTQVVRLQVQADLV
jgi:hypothetical protein